MAQKENFVLFPTFVFTFHYRLLHQEELFSLLPKINMVVFSHYFINRIKWNIQTIFVFLWEEKTKIKLVIVYHKKVYANKSWALMINSVKPYGNWKLSTNGNLTMTLNTVRVRTKAKEIFSSSNMALKPK